MLNTISFQLRHHNFKHIPGPEREAFFKGHYDIIAHLRRQYGHCNDWLYSMYLEYGDIFVFWIYRTPKLVISSPEYAKRILMYSLPVGAEYKSQFEIYNQLSSQAGPLLDGELSSIKSILTVRANPSHEQRKKLYLKFLHRSYLGNYLDVMQVVSDSITISLNKMEATDLRGVVATFVHKILAEALFGMDSEHCPTISTGCKYPLNTFFSRVEMAAKIKMMNRRNDTEGWLFMNSHSPSDIEQEVMEIRRMIFEHIQVIRHVVRRDRNNSLSPHFLSSVLSYQDLEGDTETLVNDVIAFFLMGREHMTTLILQCLYNILTQKQVYIQVLSDIDLHLGGKMVVDDIATLSKMSYVHGVILETLRLNPTRALLTANFSRKKAFFGSKMLRTAYCNHTALISPFNIHRSPDQWKDPLKFNPCRFMGAKPHHSLNKPCQFLPFGAGPRSCIGKDFSLMVAKIILVNILSMFDLKLMTEKPLKYSDCMSLRIATPLMCKLTKTLKNRTRFCS